MKKKYVNLKMQVVDVQLSDCIAGSRPCLELNNGSAELSETDTKGNLFMNEW